MKYGTSSEYYRKSDIRCSLLLSVIGVMLGSFLAAKFPLWQIWRSDIFRQGMGTSIPLQHFGSIFLYLMGMSVIWLAVIAFFGISLAGIPVSLSVLLLRGVALGAVLEEIYHLQGIAGLLTAGIFVMPYALAGLFLLSLGTREAVRFSGYLWKLVCYRIPDEETSAGLYGKRFLVLFGMLGLLNLMQSVLFMWGYPWFLEAMIR